MGYQNLKDFKDCPCRNEDVWVLLCADGAFMCFALSVSHKCPQLLVEKPCRLEGSSNTEWGTLHTVLSTQQFNWTIAPKMFCWWRHVHACLFLQETTAVFSTPHPYIYYSLLGLTLWDLPSCFEGGQNTANPIFFKIHLCHLWSWLEVIVKTMFYGGLHLIVWFPDVLEAQLVFLYVFLLLSQV